MAMVLLMEGLEAKEVCWRLCCCCGSFVEPEHACNVVRQRVDGAFADVCCPCDGIKVKKVAAQFEITVVHHPIGIQVGDKVGGDGRGELFAPQVGDNFAGGVWGKEDTAHAKARGVTGTDDVGVTRSSSTMRVGRLSRVAAKCQKLSRVQWTSCVEGTFVAEGSTWRRASWRMEKIPLAPGRPMAMD